jgi:hypothetical protein
MIIDFISWWIIFQLFRPTGGFPAQSVLLDFGEVEAVEEEIENATDSGASTKNAECRPGPEIGHHDTAGETAHSATFITMTLLKTAETTYKNVFMYQMNNERNRRRRSTSPGDRAGLPRRNKSNWPRPSCGP